ncbi:hypothetical protein RHS01_01142 [Rhizoctonia solani]|uniref:Uncharacterized protein n=1 Tax=Rhizoctonia solani TaxID=456999 RepID=A0A8H7INL3_9AGAM|nr:hypothetical protein RHS01_01142 [Rhizoctonia solani]
MPVMARVSSLINRSTTATSSAHPLALSFPPHLPTASSWDPFPTHSNHATPWRAHASTHLPLPSAETHSIRRTFLVSLNKSPPNFLSIFAFEEVQRIPPPHSRTCSAPPPSLVTGYTILFGMVLCSTARQDIPEAAVTI